MSAERLGEAHAHIDALYPAPMQWSGSLGKPVPRASRLAAVAAHGHGARDSRAAGSRVLGREHGLCIARLDAIAVVERLSAAEGPARAARRLVADIASNGGTVRPIGAHICVEN